MTNKEYLKETEDNMKKGLGIMKAKSADYAGDINPFKNFDSVETICNISSENGILVRMCDKMTRIGNLINKDAKVKDESIEDTLLDLANYSYILLARIKARKNDR